MLYDMGYTDILTTVTKFKKSCLPAQWNGIFSFLFNGLAERVVGSDGASKGFMTILYGLYHGLNLNYQSLIWNQPVQSLNSSSKHSYISYGRFWTLVTHRPMEHFQVPIIADALRSSIANFRTINIIVTDPTEFLFIGSIPESMYRCVTAKSKVMTEYRNLPPTGPRHLTPDMESVLDVVDKPAKHGKMPDQKR